MTHSPDTPSVQHSPSEDKPLFSFDLSLSKSDIEKHLEAARLSAANERVEPQSQTILLDTDRVAPTAPPETRNTTPQPDIFQSGFLAELAQEAAKKQGANLSATQALQARSQSLSDALNRIAAFFTSLTQFTNDMEPDISRLYRLDARTAFANLKWQSARIDARKQDLSSTALMAHVTFSVNYHAPEAILVTRPWNQLEALKAELGSLNLKVIDDTELDGKRPKQEWLQVHLSPDLPVYLRFQANYDKGHIDVLSRNLIAFGISSFRLKVEDITSTLLDDIGRVLLSRTDKLPDALVPI